MASIQLLRELSKNTALTQSLVKKLENLEHLTSKDSLCSDQGLGLSLRRIDLTLDHISKSLVVLHDRIEIIAGKVATLENMVNVLIPTRPAIGACVPKETEMLSDEDFQNFFNHPEWSDLLKPIPELGTSPDLTCSETICHFNNQLKEAASPSGGSMEHPVLVSPEKPMSFFQKPI